MDYLFLLISSINLILTLGILVLLFKQQRQIEKLLLRPVVIQRNDDRQHLLSIIPGHVNAGGTIELHKPYPSYLKYRGLAVEVQVVAQNQHEMMGQLQ